MWTAKFNIYFCAAVMPLLFMSTVAFSESSKKLGLDDLVRYADHIVIGKVVNVESEWSNKKIYSKNTIMVTDNIKGDELTSYVVTTLGGSAYHPGLKAGITMDVSGGMTFMLNEDVILFTKENILGQHQVVGMSQGKFNIVSEKDTGEKVIPVASKKIYSEKLTRDILAPSAQKKSSVSKLLVIRKGQITLTDFVEKIKFKMKQE